MWTASFIIIKSRDLRATSNYGKERRDNGKEREKTGEGWSKEGQFFLCNTFMEELGGGRLTVSFVRNEF